MESRHLDDIKLRAELTREQVMELWGPPEIPPTGMPYESYTLEDGQVLWLLYYPDPPYRLAGATLFSPCGERKSLFP